jgi:uncharacterized membrane protein HdeD (DUF308 family)
MFTPYTQSAFWSIFLGSLLVVTGLMAVALPLFVGIAASVFFGWLIMAGGIAHLVYAWSQRGAGAVLWQILIGIVYVGAALYMLIFPVAGVFALTLVLACYIVLAGIFELAVFSRIRRLLGATWFLVNGVISLVLAGLILFEWPSSSLWAIGSLVGISLLLSGVARITLPLRHKEVLA